MSKYGGANTWKASEEGTLANVMDIEPTGYSSPRKAAVKRKPLVDDGNPTDRIKTYFTDRGFGFTHDGVYFNAKDIIEGQPTRGAKIAYTTRETEKGKRAANIYITN